MLSSITSMRIEGKLSTPSNPLAISHNTLGVVVCITAALVASVDYVLLELAQSEGVSPNAMMLYAAICTFIGAILIDLYFWYFGYGDNQHVSIP